MFDFNFTAPTRKWKLTNIATAFSEQHVLHFDGPFFNQYITSGAVWNHFPDSKFHGANMGPIWGQQDLGGPHVGPMNLAIWVGNQHSLEWWPAGDGH